MGDIVKFDNDLKRGFQAGVSYAQSGAFDEKVYEENLRKTSDWANAIDLEPTVGNCYAVSVMAAFRTLVGDELFDSYVVDENGEFSSENVEKAKDTITEALGLDLGFAVDEHTEPTEE